MPAAPRCSRRPLLDPGPAETEPLDGGGHVLVAAAGEVDQDRRPGALGQRQRAGDRVRGLDRGMIPRSARAASASIASASVTGRYRATGLGEVAPGLDARVVQARGDRVRLDRLAVLALQHVGAAPCSTPTSWRRWWRHGPCRRRRRRPRSRRARPTGRRRTPRTCRSRWSRRRRRPRPRRHRSVQALRTGLVADAAGSRAPSPGTGATRRPCRACSGCRPRRPPSCAAPR